MSTIIASAQAINKGDSYTTLFISGKPALITDGPLQSKFEENIVSADIHKINSWDGKSELNLEPIPSQWIGAKSLYTQVKEDRNGALNMLRGIQSFYENRKTGIKRFIDFVSPFMNDKAEKQRTGDVTLKAGILNAGKTDAVIFPKGELKFKGNAIFFTAADEFNQPEYSVIAAHSFKQIGYKLATNEGNAKDIEEWKAMVKNHTSTDFIFMVKSIEKEITYTTHLDAK